VDINSAKGYGCTMLAAVMWAVSGTVAKALFLSGITAFELVQIRVILSSVLMAAAFVVFSKSLLRIRLKDLPYFFVLGCVGMAFAQGAYLYAISRIQVAAAILLQYMAPSLVAIFSIFFWKERPTFLKIVALVLAFCGCYLVVGAYSLQLLHMNQSGIMGGLASALAFAIYTLMGERGMHRYSPWTVLFYAMCFASLTWHVLYSPFHYVTAGFSGTQWLWIFYIAVAGTILPFGLYLMGINYIRSTRASITATLEPISAGFIAFFALGEAMEPLQIFGGVLVISAIALLQVQQERGEMAPALIRARGRQERRPR
jgi:drug/metabolite transporter (DMT)-like permease